MGKNSKTSPGALFKMGSVGGHIECKYTTFIFQTKISLINFFGLIQKGRHFEPR